jgi:hypothetical protein
MGTCFFFFGNTRFELRASGLLDSYSYHLNYSNSPCVGCFSENVSNYLHGLASTAIP